MLIYNSYTKEIVRYFKPSVFLILFLCFSNEAFSQAINGNVSGIESKGTISPLPYSTLCLLNNPALGASADSLGNFTLMVTDSLPQKIIVSMVGYLTDTIIVNDFTFQRITLKEGLTLEEIQIDAGRNTSRMNTMATKGVETLGSSELLKAACCNLAESFGSNASVDVVLTDAVSGAKKIQMLGLDGIYTLLTAEGIPYLRGIVSSYGLSFVPGPWIESIQISKGAGTVATGYDALAGQINIEFKKPMESEKFYLNLYAGDRGRLEGNIYAAQKLKNGWSSITLLHANGMLMSNDNNKDNFRDVPNGYQTNMMHKWNYHSGKRLEGQIGFRGLIDSRFGGTLKNPEPIISGLPFLTNYYLNSKNLLGEGFTKMGILFTGKPWKSIGTITSWRYQETGISTPSKKLYGSQRTGYMNLIYQSIISNTKHKIKFGTSLVLDNFLQHYNDSSFNRNEIVPGVFGEYDFNSLGRFSFIAGLRSDFHNLYGTRLSPRLHLKVNLWEESALRFSGGNGFRVSNPYFEQSVLASNRKVLVPEKLKAENAWNYGFSFNTTFKFLGRESQFIMDFFRTDFVNRTVADFDINPQQLFLLNLTGKSYANAAHTEIYFEPIKRFGVKLAYKYTDSKTTLAGKLQQNPFIAMHRTLINMAYSTKYDKWKFDITLQGIGKMRIPSTASNPDVYQLPGESKPYVQLNAQVTKAFKRFDVYLGGENLTNYIVSNLIISPQNANSQYFDASMMYAPAMGMNIYAGLRWKVS